MDGFYLIIFVALIIAASLVFFIGRFVLRLIMGFYRRKNKSNDTSPTKKSYHLQAFLSKNDAISEFFFLLAFAFLGTTLLAINQDMGSLLSLHTIILITSIGGIVAAYRFKLVYTLAFSLIGVVTWWGRQLAEWAETANLVAVTFTPLFLLLLLLYLSGRIHGKRKKFKRFALVYLILSFIPITLALFVLSTKPGLAIIESITKGAPIFTSWQLIVSLFVLLIILLAGAIYSLLKRIISVPEAVGVFVLVLVFILLALIPEQELLAYGSYGYASTLTGMGVIWTIIFNLLIFSEFLGMIFAGYTRNKEWLINLGVVSFFILIVVKYSDWFFSFLDKSVFFITAGVLLVVIGWLMEKTRRFTIAAAKKENSENSGIHL